MSRAKQSQADQDRRLNKGCCPIHGIGMGQAFTWYTDIDDRDFTIVECPRGDCSIQAKAYSNPRRWELIEEDDPQTWMPAIVRDGAYQYLERLGLRSVLDRQKKMLSKGHVYDPSEVDDYLVYVCPRIIDDAYMTDPVLHFGGQEEATPHIQAASQHLQRFGWEGNGLLQIMWLPSFVIGGDEFEEDLFIWHGEQEKDDLSFFASPIRLRLKQLSEQKMDDCVIESTTSSGTSLRLTTSG